jgi:phage tail-like protein
MANTGNRNDPYTAFNFLVEIDNVIVGGFNECSGLSNENDAVEYRTGDEINTVRKIPGLMKFSHITLKRGFTDSPALWEWRKKVMDGKTERQSGSVVLMNEARQAALRWTFREGWPRKLDGPAFNAKNSEIAIETLEIACERIEMD